MPHFKREQRDPARCRQVAAQARGGMALNAALARIDAAFGETAAINEFKLRVERLLRLGSEHPTLRARFAGRAATLPYGGDLDTAIAAVERWWRDERKAFQIACALGYGTRLSLETLRELRLVLRWMRFRQMGREFSAFLRELREDANAIAAE